MGVVISDNELIRRLNSAEMAKPTTESALAITGLAETPKIMLVELFEHYESITAHKRTNKTANQLRIWSIPYKRALTVLNEVVGNKPVEELKRHDALALHKNLTGKISSKEIKTNTANRMMSCLSAMFETYKRHYQLDLPTVFRGLHITETDAQTREPVPDEWIRALLQPGKLDGLNRECQAMLKVVINTGIRPSELICALPHHIRLDHNIPHLQIRAEGREIKTMDSERDIPLLGCALEAMREFPNGLERYRDKPTGCLPNTNKFLKNRDLVPKDKTGKHLTVYCFRHSFQDRLIALELPDRISKTIMGHRVDGQKYGAGPSLEHLARILKPISY